jgi:hypothetical protein
MSPCGCLRIAMVVFSAHLILVCKVMCSSFCLCMISPLLQCVKKNAYLICLLDLPIFAPKQGIQLNCTMVIYNV